MSIDEIMNIGSISKTFTATAIMPLSEKGKVSLEADVNDYIGFAIRNPKFPDKPITVFQLLTHTSSIRDGKSYNESYSCGDPGIITYLLFDPLHKIGVIAFQNNETDGTGDIVKEIYLEAK